MNAPPDALHTQRVLEGTKEREGNPKKTKKKPRRSSEVTLEKKKTTNFTEKNNHHHHSSKTHEAGDCQTGKK